MKVAVTGGSGFIGTHVVDHLVAQGHQVIVLDRAAPTHRADVEFRELDILDIDGLVAGTRGCDVVLHLAAVSNVNIAFDHPVATIEVNVTGTTNVWEAARRNEVGRAVLASTVWVYAAAPEAPGTTDDAVDETASISLADAGHLYTASKIAAELVVHSYWELYAQPFTILRYGIPFGPRMREELVIPRFVRHAFAGEPITINGDGSFFRSYVYVGDLARAHVLALDEAAENEVLNLEGAEPVSIRRVAETVRDLVNDAVEIRYLPARAGDYAGRVVSGEKAARLLGWRPEVPFEEGMRRYVEWYREAADVPPSSVSDETARENS